MRNKLWPIVAIVEAIVLVPGIVWAATGSFSSTSSTPGVTGASSYSTGKGVYGHETSTSSSLHYGVSGSASGTGGVGVYGAGAKYGVYSAGPLAVLSGKNLVCTKCVTAADIAVLPAAGVYNPSGTDVSLPDSTVTPITFTSEAFDTASLHSTTTNTSRLTAPVKGLYSVTGSVGISADTGGKRELYIYKNGALVQTESALPLLNGNATYMGISTLVAMNAADYVELEVYQGSGNTLTAFGCSTNGACPRFTMSFVSAAP